MSDTMTAERRSEILGAFAQLDPANDEHWKLDGRPQVAVMTKLVTGGVSKPEIDEVDPEFTREIAAQRAAQAADDIFGDSPAKPNVDVGADEPVGDPQPKLPEPPEPQAPKVAATPKVEPSVVNGKAVHVLNRPLPEVFASRESLLEAQADLTAYTESLAAEQNRIREELERVNVLAKQIDRGLARMPAAKPDHAVLVRDMQKQSRARRAERAAAAEVFVKSGTHVEDVRRALNPRAPIDEVLLARRSGAAGRRPTPITPPHLRS